MRGATTHGVNRTTNRANVRNGPDAAQWRISAFDTSER